MRIQLAILILLAAGGAMAQNKGGDRPQPPNGGDFIKRFDKDGDGKVSKAEFDGPDGPFAHMDKNGDGFISEDEAPKGPPPGRGGNDQQDRRNGNQRGGDFITRFDKNNDGKVSLEEFDGPPELSRAEVEEHFMMMDRNGDGFITEDEAPKGPPSRRGQEKQGM